MSRRRPGLRFIKAWPLIWQQLSLRCGLALWQHSWKIGGLVSASLMLRLKGIAMNKPPRQQPIWMPALWSLLFMGNSLRLRPTMAMGTHPSALPKRTLEEEPYTYVCQGEGPLTVEALVNVLKNGGDLSAVPGLWYRDGDGVVASTPQAEKLKDLDVLLPRQAWELLDMSKYRAHNWHSFHDLDSRGSYASLQTSLGCPYKCSFCCINTPFGGAGIRYWSPENVIAQIDELVRSKH